LDRLPFLPSITGLLQKDKNKQYDFYFFLFWFLFPIIHNIDYYIGYNDTITVVMSFVEDKQEFS
jgi:hypothetical protein